MEFNKMCTLKNKRYSKGNSLKNFKYHCPHAGCSKGCMGRTQVKVRKNVYSLFTFKGQF